jgi:prepilin-type processing-associated H-X9-DG protein
VVIGIIAVLISVLLPALSAARRQAGLVNCAAQLREIGNCFKMYELESKGYWPVARINGYGPNYPNTPYSFYNIDGFNYIGTTQQGYWFTFLAKYATKGKVGNAVGANADVAAQSRRTIFFGCPEWQGYQGAIGTNGVTVGDTNVVQVGFGMNPFPTFKEDYPTTDFPPVAETAIVAPFDPFLGRFLKARMWTKPAQRMLCADSRFWLAQSNKPPTAANYPPAVVRQYYLANAAGAVNGTGVTTVDLYRHGKAPRVVNGTFYDPYGGKILYNILYCDGHVAAATDGQEAYRSMRMKFPG